MIYKVIAPNPFTVPEAEGAASVDPSDRGDRTHRTFFGHFERVERRSVLSLTSHLIAVLPQPKEGPP